MGWNYRVFRHANPDGSGFYMIHEAHYGAVGEVSGWTENGASVCADTRDEILSVLAMMADALAHPTLDGETGAEIEPAKHLSDELVRMIELGKLGPYELDLNAEGKVIARKRPELAPPADHSAGGRSEATVASLPPYEPNLQSPSLPQQPRAPKEPGDGSAG
jgi:hypothetical protein